jgi:type II secretory pathway pseudopilin PulG
LALCSLVAGLLFSSGVWARDFLQEVQGQQEVQRQKLEADATRLLGESRRLEQTDPTRAMDLLRRLRTQLDEDRALDATRRAELLRLVDARVRTVQTALSQRQDEQDKATAQAIAKQRQQDSKPPQQPFDTAKNFVNTGRDAIDIMNKYKAQRDAGALSSFRDIERSFSNIPTGDVTFAPYWKELSELRKKMSGPQLTAEEKAVIKALNSTMSVNFDKSIFRDVVDYVQERAGVSILVDRDSLREANVEYDDPVSLSVKKATVRTILRKILGDRNLTYIIKDGVIQVVTPQKARETMVVRSYPLGDFLPTANPRFGFLGNRAQMYQAVQQVIDMIQGSIEPGSWQVNGGPGTITFNEATRSLIIRNSAELHYSMRFGGIAP